MAEGFEAKKKSGEARAHGSGYGGTGFKFDATEANLVKEKRKVGRGSLCCGTLCCALLCCAVYAVLHCACCAVSVQAGARSAAAL